MNDTLASHISYEAQRLRMTVMQAVAIAMDQHGPIDPERGLERQAHDIALAAAMRVAGMLIFGNAEIDALRIELARYRKIAESRSALSPMPQLLDPNS